MKDKVTIKELAEHYGVSVVTVNSWKRKGCPFYRIPNENNLRYRVFFSLAEVENWRIAEHNKRGA